jgi:hypothetical protein
MTDNSAVAVCFIFLHAPPIPPPRLRLGVGMTFCNCHSDEPRRGDEESVAREIPDTIVEDDNRRKPIPFIAD